MRRVVVGIKTKNKQIKNPCLVPRVGPVFTSVTYPVQGSTTSIQFLNIS